MKAVAVVLALCVGSVPLAASAFEARANVKLDSSVAAFTATPAVTWSGREAELALEFGKENRIIAGGALGIRREGPYFTDGTYVVARIFGRFGTKARWLTLYPSLGVVYGLPGAPMCLVHDGLAVFPVRTIGTPPLINRLAEMDGEGVLYPELSIALRARWKRFSVEPLIGVRLIRFGFTGSGGAYHDERVVVPSAGIRAGFRVW